MNTRLLICKLPRILSMLSIITGEHVTRLPATASCFASFFCAFFLLLDRMVLRRISSGKVSNLAAVLQTASQLACGVKSSIYGIQKQSYKIKDQFSVLLCIHHLKPQKKRKEDREVKKMDATLLPPQLRRVLLLRVLSIGYA